MAAWTAFALGPKSANNSPEVIEEHYRHLVSKADVAKFWEIKPKVE
jgi:hypothetical protein